MNADTRGAATVSAKASRIRGFLMLLKLHFIRYLITRFGNISSSRRIRMKQISAFDSSPPERPRFSAKDLETDEPPWLAEPFQFSNKIGNGTFAGFPGGKIQPDTCLVSLTIRGRFLAPADFMAMRPTRGRFIGRFPPTQSRREPVVPLARS